MRPFSGSIMPIQLGQQPSQPKRGLSLMGGAYAAVQFAGFCSQTYGPRIRQRFHGVLKLRLNWRGMFQSWPAPIHLKNGSRTARNPTCSLSCLSESLLKRLT